MFLFANIVWKACINVNNAVNESVNVMSNPVAIHISDKE